MNNSFFKSPHRCVFNIVNIPITITRSIFVRRAMAFERSERKRVGSNCQHVYAYNADILETSHHVCIFHKEECPHWFCVMDLNAFPGTLFIFHKKTMAYT